MSLGNISDILTSFHLISLNVTYVVLQHGLFAGLDDLVSCQHQHPNQHTNDRKETLALASSSPKNEKRDRVRKSVAQGCTMLHYIYFLRKILPFNRSEN
jgi:hypothetical protein